MVTAQGELVTVDASVDKKTPRRKQPLMAGVAASFCLHLTVAVAVIVIPYLVWLRMFTSSLSNEPQITIVASIENEQPEEPPAAVVEVSSQVTEVPVEKLVDKQVEAANRRLDDENLDELTKQSARLEKISDAESVEAMAGKFHQWLGTKKRASQPAEQPVAGKFDFGSAQIHDVKREQREDGTWRYVCELVDAEGRSVETELDDIEGEKQYRIFQRLKQSPLAEKVYREIAMPLLDKMLQDRR